MEDTPKRKMREKIFLLRSALYQALQYESLTPGLRKLFQATLEETK